MHNQVDYIKSRYSRNSYYNGLTAEYLNYNANLQELSQKIAYICELESGRKISAEQAYEEVKRLWLQFKQNREELGIGVNASN